MPPISLSVHSCNTNNILLSPPLAWLLEARRLVYSLTEKTIPSPNGTCRTLGEILPDVQ